MHVLIAIALKSLIVAGAALGLLAIMKTRSAAERSRVAHTGLLALVLLALAPLVLPSWTVETPALLGETSSSQPAVQAPLESTRASAPAAAPAATGIPAPEKAPAVSM